MTLTPEPERRRAPRLGFVLGVVFAVAALALSGYLFVTLRQTDRAQQIEELTQRYGGTRAVGGPFRLRAAAGQLLTEATSEERMTLLFFGFTHCPDVCPTALTKVGAALDLLPAEDREQVRPIFVSVDPERDTPELLAQYVAYFHPMLIGATAEPGTLDEMIAAFRAYYRKVPLENGDYTVDHSAILYLLDAQGRSLALFGQATDAEDLAKAMHDFAQALRLARD